MKKLLSRKNKGFTLIELMIVVAIIGILAAIAIPNFIRYQLRSKTAEARTNMGGIKTNQESFRSDIDNYANVTTVTPAATNGTTKTEWEVNDCPATCDRTTPGDCTTFECVGYRPAGQVYYQYESIHVEAAPGIPAEFCIAANADLDGDTNIGQFEYQSGNDAARANVADCPLSTLGACGGTVIAGEIFECNPGTY